MSAFEEEDYFSEQQQWNQRAIAEPNFDYFEAYRPDQPKATIGQYVADEGFSVPLITDQEEWKKAFDNGTAMLRSELPQDYDGLSGLLSSEKLRDSLPQRWAEVPEGFVHDLGELILRGLRSGELHPSDYMKNFRGPYMNWTSEEAELVQTAANFGGLDYLNMHNASASQWHYIEGTNVSVFADPHVEGRYHFGVRPVDPETHRDQAIGGYQFEADEYDTPKQFRKHDQPFVAWPFVEYYEQIRNLPRFDTTQCPVLELQQDVEGNIHFLQYLKTGQRKDYIEPFDLPVSEDILHTTNVRGITPPDGKQMRMFMAPNLLKKGMEDQAIFCRVTGPRYLEVQLAAKAASFILHEAYISFQDNHFDSSPLYSPPLAAGLSGGYDSSQKVREKVGAVLEDASVRRINHFDRENVAYLDIQVTSNGREAAIESDWEVKVIPYEEVR